MSTATVLLTTKLYRPPPRANLVLRLRLLQRLNQALTHPLTLVSGPAGFGKSTLVSAWVEHCAAGQRNQASAPDCSPTVAWLSLDEDDNDPGRFLRHLIAALQTLTPEVGEAALTLLQSPQPPPPKPLLTALINDLAAFSENVPTEHAYLLVLDDYHAITAPTLHEGVTFLIEHLPPQWHIVLVTRTDPPLPLARWRARNQLTELRTHDLRFTAEETAAFLNGTMGLSLSAEHTTALATRTEGWIVGLHLAALSLQGHPDRPRFIQAFTGSQRYVMDYLVEEVLQRQPAAVQLFLLQTSLLDRLCGPLCERVADPVGTSPIPGHTMLAQLERTNLFLIPLDEAHHWYRYHHLFADLLRYRLHQTQAEHIPTLHARASAWYERHGFVAEAITHALSAQDFARAAGLIEQHAQAMWMRGEKQTLLDWLDALPEAVVSTYPRLCLLHAWVLCLGNQLDAAQRRLQDAERMLEPSTLEGQGIAAAIGAAIAHLQGNAPHSIALSRQALAQLPKDDAIWRGVTAVNLGLAYQWISELAAATQALTEAISSCQTASNVYFTLVAKVNLAKTHELQGQLRRAAALYQQALPAAVGQQAHFPFAGVPAVYLGGIFYEWNDLAAAAHQLTTGIQPLQQWGEREVVAQGYMTLARVAQAEGAPARAAQLLERATQLLHELGRDHTVARELAGTQMQLWLTQGQLAAALQWAQEVGLPVDEAPAYAHESEAIARVRLWLAQGHLAEALGLVRRLLPAAERGGRTGRVLELLILQALVLQAQGHRVQALPGLARALSLAESEGYLRLFVDEGASMQALLAELQKQLTHQSGDARLHAYVNRVLVVFAAERQRSKGRDEPARVAFPRSPAAVPMSEPLSERELEVLRLIAAGLSNQAIAQKLVITVGTVKTHINNLYGKLQVGSRIQAVTRAQELQLL